MSEEEKVKEPTNLRELVNSPGFKEEHGIQDRSNEDDPPKPEDEDDDDVKDGKNDPPKKSDDDDEGGSKKKPEDDDTDDLYNEDGEDDDGEDGDDDGDGDGEDDDSSESLESLRKKQEADIFQATDGQASSIEELLELHKTTAEKKEGPLKINNDVLKKIDDTVREKKGFGIVEALQWDKLDAKQLKPLDRLYMAMELKNPDQPESFYAMQRDRFKPITHMTKEEREEAFESGELDRSNYNQLLVEHDQLVYNFDKSIAQQKEKFDISDIFEVDRSPDGDEPKEFSPEEKSTVNKGLSKTLKDFNGVSQKVSLPKNLGDIDVNVPISDSDKRDLMNVSPEKLAPYRKEDGTYDFQKYVDDTLWSTKRDDLVHKMAKNVASQSLQRFLKNRDRIGKKAPEGKPHTQMTPVERARERIQNRGRKAQR